MASVVTFPHLPAETNSVGPNTLQERLGGLLQCDTDEFLSAGSRAKLFTRMMTGWAYYVPDNKQWAVWSEEDARWVLGDPETTVLPLMEQFIERMMDVAEQRRVAVATGETGLLSNKALFDLLRRVKHHQQLHKPSTEWDDNPYLLGVQNGVVDLRDGRLYRSCRGAFVTIHTHVPYHGRRVHSDYWDKLLVDITTEDRELRLFLRDWFGSLLTGANPRERFTLLYGPGGTGKGTLMSAVMACLGPYAMAIPADTITKRYGGGGGPREDLADMQGRRIVACLELTNESELDPTLIKTLTGQDIIRARGLYQRGRHIRPTWSLVACSNAWPRLSSTPDSGWWRRMLAVPFLNRPKYPDLSLKAHLIGDDREQRSILSWLIAGSVSYYRNHHKSRHWQPPHAVQATLGKYRMQYDHIGYWVEQCVRRGSDDDACTNSDVYASYLEWCNFHDLWPEEHLTSTWVGRALASEGYMRKRIWSGTSSARGWCGFKLVDPSTPPEIDWEQDSQPLPLTEFEV